MKRKSCRNCLYRISMTAAIEAGLASNGTAGNGQCSFCWNLGKQVSCFSKGWCVSWRSAENSEIRQVGF